MRSKVLSFPDIEKIKLRPEQCRVERSDHRQEIESEIDFVRRKTSEVVEKKQGEPVEEGDALTLSVSCDDPDAPSRFNREKIGINIGKNFYDRRVEETILVEAAKVGDTLASKAGKDGEFDVSVTILAARHTVTRPLTDQDFVNEGILNGVETANEAEFRAFLEEVITDAENLDHFYDHIIDDLTAELVENSEFHIDQKEYDDQVEIWYSELRDLPDYLGDDAEDIGFIEYVQGVTGSEKETREELIPELFRHYDQAFKYNLILLELAKDQPEPTEEEYRQMMEELRQEGHSEEELASVGGYEEFVKERKLEIGQDILRAALEKQYIN